MESKPELQVAYNLPVPIQFTFTALSTALEVHFNDLPMTVLLPNLEWFSDDPHIVAPSEMNASPEELENLWKSDPWQWGSVLRYRMKDKTDGVAIVRAVVFVFPMRPPLPIPIEIDDRLDGTSIIKQLSDSIDALFRRVATWIEVLVGQNLDPYSSRKSALVVGDRMAAWVLDSNRSQRLHVNSPIAIVRENVNPVDCLTWQRALRNAAQGLEPPTEHLLIRDASSALRRSDCRRVVIDAGTATELALTKLLESGLENLPAQLRQALLKERWMLHRLILLVGSFVELPGELQKNVAQPRNLAAHRAYEPDSQQAARALRLASEVVEIATPKSLI
jgi:hypothetical protein